MLDLGVKIYRHAIVRAFPYPNVAGCEGSDQRDILYLYALGAIAGITGEPFADREPDWREPNAALARVEKYFPLKK